MHHIEVDDDSSFMLTPFTREAHRLHHLLPSAPEYTFIILSTVLAVFFFGGVLQVLPFRCSVLLPSSYSFHDKARSHAPAASSGAALSTSVQIRVASAAMPSTPVAFSSSAAPSPPAGRPLVSAADSSALKTS